MAQPSVEPFILNEQALPFPPFSGKISGSRQIKIGGEAMVDPILEELLKVAQHLFQGNTDPPKDDLLNIAWRMNDLDRGQKLTVLMLEALGLANKAGTANQQDSWKAIAALGDPSEKEKYTPEVWRSIELTTAIAKLKVNPKSDAATET